MTGPFHRGDLMDFSARNHFLFSRFCWFPWKKGKIDDLVPRKRINLRVRQLPGSRFPLAPGGGGAQLNILREVMTLNRGTVTAFNEAVIIFLLTHGEVICPAAHRRGKREEMEEVLLSL